MAAELRAEARRIAEEERAEARAEAKARRKREEAERLRVQEEETARVAAERLRVQQDEVNLKAYEQQCTLMRLQTEMGEKAAEAQRQEDLRVRRRDGAVAGVPDYREPEDVEDFLCTSERKLRMGGVHEREWLTIMATKLTGKVGATWQDLCTSSEDYGEVRSGLLRVCGYTPKLAGEAFYGFRSEALKGMSADQAYHRGAQLLRRMVAPLKLSAEVEFALLKPWVWSLVGRKARQVLDARVIKNSGDLVGALQDYLVTEGERVEGQAALFRYEGQAVVGRRQAQGVDSGAAERKRGVANGSGSSSITCFKCGKLGHKAADCWQGSGSASLGSSKPATGPSKVVCYTCGVEGHKSPACPKKDGVNVSVSGGVPKPVRQLWVRDSTDSVIEGMVNEKKASILLDSGASITIVPEVMVESSLRTGERVVVRPFQCKTPMSLPMAKVKFHVEGLEDWEEKVALAPVERGKESEVLFSLDLRSPRGLDLVILVNKLGQGGVLRVTTRSESRQETLDKEENAKVVAQERPKVKSLVVEAVDQAVEATGTVREEGPGVGVAKPVFSEVEMKGSEKSVGKGKPVADRPAGDPEPMTQDEAIGGELPELVVAEEVDSPGVEEVVEELEYSLRERNEGMEDLQIPPVNQGSGGSRQELVEAVRVDPTLESWRELADKGEQGFCWERDLLYQTRTTHTFDLIHLMVLPLKFRGRVLKMAHEESGHLGARNC